MLYFILFNYDELLFITLFFISDNIYNILIKKNIIINIAIYDRLLNNFINTLRNYNYIILILLCFTYYKYNNLFKMIINTIIKLNLILFIKYYFYLFIYYLFYT